MLTLKQMEALRWIVVLGSFERAAERLNTTQSAITKRIKELEAVLGVALFDRSQRGARLTYKGEEVLALGEEMLALRDRVIDVTNSQGTPIRHLKFGVTELTALTWLPAFIAELRSVYPNIILEPEVEQSVDLFERLREGKVDFVIVPDAFWQPQFKTVPLASVENSWMCSPLLLHDRHMIPLKELTEFSVLTQGNRSGSGLVFDKWLRQHGIKISQLVKSNSLIALVGLTIAAIGVSYLPRHCFEALTDQGKLRIIETDPALPAVTYVAMFRPNESGNVIEAISRIARSTCNFSKPIRWA